MCQSYDDDKMTTANELCNCNNNDSMSTISLRTYVQVSTRVASERLSNITVFLAQVRAKQIVIIMLLASTKSNVSSTSLNTKSKHIIGSI